MTTWAVANQKGGVGKTTTAVTLAGWLARMGHEVLLVDLDPHGSLTSYFGLDPETLERGVYTLFERSVAKEPLDPQGVIHPTGFERLSVLPASTALATLDRQLGAQGGMGLVVARALREVAGHYQHVFIDCPPMMGVLMVNALAACEHLVVPVQTEFLALKGLERMVHSLEMIQRSRRMDLPYTIVPTMFDRRTRAAVDSLRQVRERYGARVWEAMIPVDTQFREASKAGVPLSLRAPGSRGARAYQALLESLIDRVQTNKAMAS
ncbi:MAG: ParA family protein [Chromatiales bacterium]|nr:ParA family protein [Chromatiales bacterium]